MSSWHSWLLLAILAIIVTGIVGIAVLIPMSISEHIDWEAKCTRAGGVPFVPRDAKVCLNPQAIIRL